MACLAYVKGCNLLSFCRTRSVEGGLWLRLHFYIIAVVKAALVSDQRECALICFPPGSTAVRVHFQCSVRWYHRSSLLRNRCDAASGGHRPGARCWQPSSYHFGFVCISPIFQCHSRHPVDSPGSTCRLDRGCGLRTRRARLIRDKRGADSRWARRGHELLAFRWNPGRGVRAGRWLSGEAASAEWTGVHCSRSDSRHGAHPPSWLIRAGLRSPAVHLPAT